MEELYVCTTWWSRVKVALTRKGNRAQGLFDWKRVIFDWDPVIFDWGGRDIFDWDLAELCVEFDWGFDWRKAATRELMR